MEEELSWRYSTLHAPGCYLDSLTRRPISWSGEPRHIQTWQQAEWNAAAQMRALGYRDAEVTPPGIDEGIDIYSSKALAQVKREAAHVGRPMLQLFYGACSDTPRKEMWFFSASGYARTALKWADRHSILLFTYSVTGELTPKTALAERTYNRLLAQRVTRLAKLRAAREQLACSREALSAPVIPAGAVLV